METNLKVTNAISALRKVLEEHNQKHIFKIVKGKIIINNNKPAFWSTLLYIIVVILTPTGFFLYEIIFKGNTLLLFGLILFLMMSVYSLIRLINVENALTINLTDKYFCVRNINGLFKSLISPTIIPFNEVRNIELVIRSDAGLAIAYKALILLDQKERKTILTEFSFDYPHYFIAEKIKVLLDTILDNT